MKRILAAIVLALVITGCGNCELCTNYCFWYMNQQDDVIDPIFVGMQCVLDACTECYPEDDDAMQEYFGSMEEEVE